MDKLQIASQGLQTTHIMDPYGQGQISACFSKNLDWFSSAQSIKASAFSDPTQLSNDVYEEDEKGRYQLRNDCTVWDKEKGRVVIGNNYTAMIKKVTYPKRVQDGVLKPEKLIVFYEGDEMKSMVAITNKYMRIRQPDGLVVKPIVFNEKKCKGEVVYENGEWVAVIKNTEKTKSFSCDVSFDIPGIAYENIMIHKNPQGSEVDARIEWIKSYTPSMRYDEITDAMVGDLAHVQEISERLRDGEDSIEFQIPIYGRQFYQSETGALRLRFEVVQDGKPRETQFT